jgi:hypothetical protein
VSTIGRQECNVKPALRTWQNTQTRQDKKTRRTSTRRAATTQPDAAAALVSRDQSGAHAHKDTNTTPGKVTLLTKQQRHQAKAAQNHTHLPRTHAVCAHKNRLHTKTTPSLPNPLYPHRNPHCPNKQVAPPPRPPPLLARLLACLLACLSVHAHRQPAAHKQIFFLPRDPSPRPKSGLLTPHYTTLHHDMNNR